MQQLTDHISHRNLDAPYRPVTDGHDDQAVVGDTPEHRRKACVEVAVERRDACRAVIRLVTQGIERVREDRRPGRHRLNLCRPPNQRTAKAAEVDLPR